MDNFDGIPKQFGPYEILSRLGAGGMGSVFKALDTSFNRFVALKITESDKKADKETIARFETEAYAMKRLDHQNIVPIYNYGLIEDRQYIAIKFIEGKTLGEFIQNSKIPFSYIVDYSKQICRGLRYAHKNGIVHRDVKPANIIIDDESRLYLMDFGISVLRDQEQRHTMVGIAMGTPEYMSPEQCRGLEVDALSDVYSFGIILYEMISNAVPFVGNDPKSIAKQQIHEEAPSLSNLRAKIPAKLIEITMRCLQKEKENRYGSMDEILLDLDNVVYDNLSEKKAPKPSTQKVKSYTPQPSLSIFWKSLIVGSILFNFILGLMLWQNRLSFEKVISPAFFLQNGKLLQDLSDESQKTWWESPTQAKETVIKFDFKSPTLIRSLAIQLPPENERSQFESAFELILETNKGSRRSVKIQDLSSWQWFQIDPIESTDWVIRIRPLNSSSKSIALSGIKFSALPTSTK
jgi:serine/threonine protein kinase